MSESDFRGIDLGLEMAAPIIGMRRSLIDSGIPEDVANGIMQSVMANSVEQLHLQRAEVEANTAAIHAAIAGVDISNITKKGN